MFGSIKKAMVAGAVVAVGGFAAPAMASAVTWSPAGGATAVGALSMSVGSSVTTCDVAATVNLTNSPGAGGSVSSFLLTPCTTNVPNCSVTAVADLSSAWAITVTSVSRVKIDGVKFTNSYSGASCALNGANITATGDVEGDYSGNVLSFVNEGGLTATGPGLPPGGAPALVNGEVELFSGATPVLLTP